MRVKRDKRDIESDGHTDLSRKQIETETGIYIKMELEIQL